MEQNLFPSRRVSAAGVSKSFFYPFFPRKQSKLFCFDLQRHYCVHFAAQKIVFGQVPLKVNQITCFLINTIWVGKRHQRPSFLTCYEKRTWLMKERLTTFIFHCQEVATFSKNLEKIIKNTNIFRQSFCLLRNLISNLIFTHQ